MATTSLFESIKNSWQYAETRYPLYTALLAGGGLYYFALPLPYILGGIAAGATSIYLSVVVTKYIVDFAQSTLGAIKSIKKSSDNLNERVEKLDAEKLNNVIAFVQTKIEEITSTLNIAATDFGVIKTNVSESSAAFKAVLPKITESSAAFKEVLTSTKKQIVAAQRSLETISTTVRGFTTDTEGKTTNLLAIFQEKSKELTELKARLDNRLVAVPGEELQKIRENIATVAETVKTVLTESRLDTLLTTLNGTLAAVKGSAETVDQRAQKSVVSTLFTSFRKPTSVPAPTPVPASAPSSRRNSVDLSAQLEAIDGAHGSQSDSDLPPAVSDTGLEPADSNTSLASAASGSNLEPAVSESSLAAGSDNDNDNDNGNGNGSDNDPSTSEAEPPKKKGWFW